MTTQLGEIILYLNLFFIILSFFFIISAQSLYTRRINVLIFMNRNICMYKYVIKKKRTYSFLVSRCVSYARLRASLCPNFSFHTDVAPSLRTPCLEKEINIIIIMNRNFYT